MAEVNMLREFKPTRQVPGEPKRRWFESSRCDLIIWLHPDESAKGFQFCYDKDSKEHALTWLEGSGFSHMAVDHGPSVTGHGKGTPLLTVSRPFDVLHIRDEFRKEAESLPAEYVELVTMKLDELGRLEP
jgi:hypothetical protein